MNAYRFAIGLLLAMLFAGQGTIQTRLNGTPKELAGYAISIAFLLTAAEFATLALGRRIGRFHEPRETPTVSLTTVMTLATLLLVLNLGAKFLSPYFALQRRPPLLAGSIVVAVAWVGVLILAGRTKSPARICVLGIAGLVGVSRLLVLQVVPFERLTGDMLATIDRSLTLLLAGRFPYVDFPPPMPYLPGIFLAYAPAKWLGGDLRLTNVVCETLSALLAAGLFWPRLAPSRRIEVGRVALPLLMLNPVWTYFGTNSQYAPFLLVTVIFGRAMLARGPRVQAGALGLLLGTNQMLVVAAPIVFGWWIGQHGLKRALRLSSLTAMVLLAVLAPFLAWNPAQFLRITFERHGTLPASVLAGRFSLYPWVGGYSPLATLGILVVGILVARSARRAATVLATVAIALCAAMLVQPVSFSHYFLPVMALAALTTASPVPAPSGTPLRGPTSRLSARSSALPEPSSG